MVDSQKKREKRPREGLLQNVGTVKGMPREDMPSSSSMMIRPFGPNWGIAGDNNSKQGMHRS